MQVLALAVQVLLDLPRERLDQPLAEVRRYGGVCAELCLELDRFETVNDTLGHLAGNVVLRKVAERLRGAVRGEEMVARLGGDGFAVMLAGGIAPMHVSALTVRLSAVG
jgi:diguanylate cyclase (GGDEF)-like protein